MLVNSNILQINDLQLNVSDLRKTWFETSFLLDQKQTQNNKAQERFDNFDKIDLKYQFPIQFNGKKSIFEGKGNCAACHRIDEKLVGPSVQEMATIYKKQNGDLVSFLKDEAKPIVDPSQYEVMKANLALTKEMSDEELKGLEAYIYSQVK
jgi:cytochrome c551/c552